MKTPAPHPFQTVFRPGLFAGRTAIVTGGGSGIGRCIAHELAALGARVALVGRKLDKLEAVAREIAAAGGAAIFHSCDIREEERVRETVAAVVAQFGASIASSTTPAGSSPRRSNRSRPRAGTRWCATT